MSTDQLEVSSQQPLPAETQQDLEETQTKTRDDTSFPIVGIGASAGGLEAFTQLLKALPCDTGLAFVLVQHLAPTHASALAEILSRATKMSVAEVQNASTVEPNHVYVIPPARSMIIAGDTLQLLPREENGMHRPIDQFFRSLAEECRHRAIGVVLSGTATDGTLGLEAIKAEGGITFAQDATAQHEGMPHSAIASGCVDFVLSPDEIAREIVRIAHHPYVVPKKTVQVTDDKPIFAEILQLLHQSTDVDFVHYKFNTLYRRITRRMVLQKLNDLSQYLELLRNTPAELEALYQDILISVTSFFRDPESFDALKTVVFPRLLEGRTRHDPVRIWTLGCSTGQEAYSLAMAYMEAADAVDSQAPLQVFATDLNAANIERARAGVYSKDIAQDVSPERLRRFFTECDSGYRITKTIRDACVFSRHNVLADPPFSRIDVISCRNLLIYLEPVLQQRILPLLHYALKLAGCLWLGGSETIGNFRNLFESEDAKHKIYNKKPGSTTDRGHFALQHGGTPRTPFVPFSAQPVDAAVDLHKEADRILLTKFAPPGVVVSADLEILQYRGDTDPFLTPAPGKASFSLLKMLREGLLVGVRAAILQAGKEQLPVRNSGLKVKSGGSYHDVAIEVIPLRKNREKNGGFLILFALLSQASRERQPSGHSERSETLEHQEVDTPCSRESTVVEADNVRLELELVATRDYLQSLLEGQEVANEELQSANEEVQSANEELQSTNEELETSKEEIQSSNEELATVNDELNNRNAELSRVNNDLVNLVASIQSAVVMLGPDLRVRRFTPSAETLLNLIPTDVGRPLADIKFNLDGLPDLASLLKAVLDTACNSECEVRDKRGHWYSLRLRPYRTADDVIDGVVMTLFDVDTIKREQEYARSIISTVREPLVVLDSELRVQSASSSFYETFQVFSDVTINRPLFELGNGQWDIPDLRRLLVELLPLKNEVTDFEMEHEFENIGRKSMRLNARRLIQTADQAPLILLAIEDVTERNHMESELRRQAVQLSELHRRKDEFLAMLSHELRSPLAPIANAVQLLGLQKSGESRIQQQARGIIERQVGQLQHLVDDLLEVSRITTGRVQLRLEQVDMCSIAEGAVETVRPLIEQRRHELTVSLPLEPVWMLADAARLEQVLVNLLTNAVKYTEAGGHISLTVDLAGSTSLAVRSSALPSEHLLPTHQASEGRESPDIETVVHPEIDIPSLLNGSSIPLAKGAAYGNSGNEIVIRVRDTGVGIPPALLPHIFDLFTQAERSLDRSQGGLGIGLALVQRLTELHGGKVDAFSILGEGSEFVVRLPLLSSEEREPNNESDADSSLESRHSTLATPLKVLVVDDNVDTVLGFSMLLKASGHEVRTAHDGLAAVEAAIDYQPDVILLDIGLPGLNGYEVAKRIRRHPQLKDIVLIALTGYGQDTDRQTSQQAGFDHHLVKPARFEELKKILANVQEGLM